MASSFSIPNSLRDLWDQHTTRLVAHGNQPLLPGLYVDCQDTLINSETHLIEDPLLQFMRAARDERGKNLNLVSREIYYARFHLWAQKVDIFSMTPHEKQKLIKNLAKKGAVLEMLVDDNPEAELHALTTIHPAHLMKLMRDESASWLQDDGRPALRIGNRI
jgi:hypothetical protein